MIAGHVSVYLVLGPVDPRGAFDQLAAVTRKVLSLDPASGALFLFVNRRRNRLKALWWDRNGYTLLYEPHVRFILTAPSRRLDQANHAPSSRRPQGATEIIVGSTKTTGG